VILPVSFRRTVEPTVEPLEPETARLHLRGLAAVEDPLLLGWISAARSMVEEYTGRALMTQTWTATMETWPLALRLQRAVPLQSVTSIQYYDAANALQTLDTSIYLVSAFEPALITLADGKTWPALARRPDAVRVTYVAGATSAADVPQPLVQAMLLLCGHWDANRSLAVVGTSAEDLPWSVRALCGPFYRQWDPAVAA